MRSAKRKTTRANPKRKSRLGCLPYLAGCPNTRYVNSRHSLTLTTNRNSTGFAPCAVRTACRCIGATSSIFCPPIQRRRKPDETERMNVNGSQRSGLKKLDLPRALCCDSPRIWSQSWARAQHGIVRRLGHGGVKSHRRGANVVATLEAAGREISEHFDRPAKICRTGIASVLERSEHGRSGCSSTPKSESPSCVIDPSKNPVSMATHISQPFAR